MQIKISDLKKIIIESMVLQRGEQATDVLHRKYGTWLIGDLEVNDNVSRIEIATNRLPPREDIDDVVKLLRDYGFNVEKDPSGEAVLVSV